MTKEKKGGARAIKYPVEDVGNSSFSETQLHDALNAARMYMWEWNLQTGRILCSQGAATILGRESGAVEDFKALLHAEDRLRVEQALQEAIDGGDDYDMAFRVHSPTGIRWLASRGQLIRNEAGEAVRFVGVTTDISKRKNAEQALAESQVAMERQRRSYEAILTNTPDLAYIFGPDHRFVYANDGLLRMWGRTWEEAIGKNCLELGYEPWHAEMHGREIDQVIATRQSVRGVVPFNGTFGRRMYDYILVPVFGADGTVEAVAGTTRDITDILQSEVDLREAKNAAEAANEAKSEFLANMSHEIRTPLNAVVGIASLLERGLSADKQAQMVKTLRTSADALLELINDLLDISKIEQRDFTLAQERFQLDELFSDVISMLAQRAREKNIALAVDYEAVRGLRYDGDKHRLRQILINLIGNAIKFTEKGAVTVHVLRPASFPGCNGIEIQIIDTGIGIPHEAQATIFEKFSRAPNAMHVPGTGLGLPITKHLVEMMGGTVHLESKEGFGTKVYLCLPDKFSGNRQSRTTIKDTTRANTFTTDQHILLVEDFAANVMVASAILDDIGVSYDVAYNGEEALSLLKSREYGLVLMDVNMPVKDGHSATRELREWEKTHAGSRTNVIGMTAHALAGDRDQCLQAGMDDFLAKPVTAEALFEKIRKYLKSE